MLQQVEFPRQLDVIQQQGFHFTILLLSEMSGKMITQAENYLESTQALNGANTAQPSAKTTKQRQRMMHNNKVGHF